MEPKRQDAGHAVQQFALRNNPFRTKFVWIACILVTACAVCWFAISFYSELRTGEAKHIVSASASVMRDDLKDYVDQTGHFPASLEAAGSEGKLRRSWLVDRPDCKSVYIPPFSNAPGSSVVFLVSKAGYRATVTKDFHLIYSW
jgi:hypothetical protein